MAYVRVSEWTPEQVADWLYGLDDVIRPYACAFLNNDIGGRHLVTLASDDLHGLNIWKLGHQELLLEAAEHLSQSFFHLETENLQWLALRLSCKARSLYNALPRDEDSDKGVNDGIYGVGGAGGGGGGTINTEGRPTPNEEELRRRRRKLDHVTTSTLSAVSDVIASVKALVQWLDRPPFDASGHGQQSVESAYVRMRTELLQLGVELAMNAQRDKFAERPNTVIRNACLVMATMCDKLIQESKDSLILQPASLEVATVRKKPNEELGMHIQCLFSGSHIIGRVKYQSPASSGGRVERGDEIVQVNYQTVVGWTLKKLVGAMKENPTEVILTLKKRPRHTSPFGRIYTQHFLFAVKPYVERRSSNASKKKFGKPPNKPVAGVPEPVCTFSPSLLMPPPSLPSSGTACSSLLETVTTEDEEDDDSAFLSEVDSRSSAVDVQLTVPKLQVALQRRATVTGASPTSSRPPVSIDQLWHDTKRDIINRSYSYDVSGSVTAHGSLQKQQQVDKYRRGVIGRPLPSPPSISYSNADHEKLPVSTSRKTYGGETISSSHYETLVVAKESIAKEKVETVVDESPEPELSRSNHYEDIEQRMSDSKSVDPVESLLIDDDSSCKSYQVVVVGGVAQKCHPIPKENKRSPLPSPLLRHKGKRWEFANRRISCKDLGRGDCQGWLHRGRARSGVKGTSGIVVAMVHKWAKRWCVLKTDGLYVYEDVQAQKAECFLCLVGFSISPAPECKSKKYAFKAYHSGTEFYFASDSQRDMSKWMNKMGLAAISFDMQNLVTTSGFLSPSKQSVIAESVFYSESEEDVEDTRKSTLNESRMDSADGSSISPSSSSSYHSTLESPPPPKASNSAGAAERTVESLPIVLEQNISTADRVRLPPVSHKIRECSEVTSVSKAVGTDTGNDAGNLPPSNSIVTSDMGTVRMSLAFEMNLDSCPPRRNLAAAEESVSLWSSSTLPSTSARGQESNTIVTTNTLGPRNHETTAVAAATTKSLTMSALKLFGSPKFVKKFAASHRQPAFRSSSDRNPSSVWFNSMEKNSKPGSQDFVMPPPPLPSPEKRFLRSPRLTRAFFSSKATSIDNCHTRVPVLTATSDKRVEVVAKRVESTELFRISSIPSLPESDALDGQSEDDVGQFTFASLPSTDIVDCFPRLPLKPTMGVSMIGKQRRTSTQSTDSMHSSVSSSASTSSKSAGHHQQQQQQQQPHQTVPLFVSMASQGTQTENGVF